MRPQFEVVEVDEHVWRVGFRPDPWAWSDWIWAVDGRFDGRWDDSAGNFRTVYAGTTLLGCLLEVLACFRPDSVLVGELEGIDEDDLDAEHHPTTPPGSVPHNWADKRLIGTATLRGPFCAVTSAASIAALRPDFIASALTLGLHDFDAAALKDGRPRALTQAVATALHQRTGLVGVVFNSRLGDELTLFAIFERAGDPSVSPRLTDRRHLQLTHDHPDVASAFELLSLIWADEPPPPMPLPIEAVAGAEVWAEHTTSGDPDPTAPFGAALLWWQGLLDHQENQHALRVMSFNPDAWGDYSEAAGILSTLSILTKVEDNPDRDDIKYVRFIEYSGAEAGRVFADAALTDIWVVTLVKREGDDWWRVWGLSHNHFPTADKVLGLG